MRSPGGSASTPLCSRSRVLFHLVLTTRGVDEDSSLSLCHLIALKVTSCGNNRAFPGRSDIQSNEVAIFEMSDGGVQLTPNLIVNIWPAFKIPGLKVHIKWVQLELKS